MNLSKPKEPRSRSSALTLLVMFFTVLILFALKSSIQESTPPEKLSVLQEETADLEDLIRIAFQSGREGPIALVTFKLENLAEDQNLKRAVIKQLKTDIGNSFSKGKLSHLYNAMETTEGDQGNTIDLKISGASSQSLHCYEMEQIRDEHGMIIAAYYVGYSGPKMQGNKVNLWVCSLDSN
jgi:hypothetical protein